MGTLSFRVYGTPAPQGSKTAFVRNGRAVVVDGGSSAVGREKLSSWRAEVAREAHNERPEVPITGPVVVDITFYLPRPKVAKYKIFCDKKPDIDKLIRATLDSMTGVIFVDDSQVAKMSVTKLYTTPECSPGAIIAISGLEVPTRTP